MKTMKFAALMAAMMLSMMSFANRWSSENRAMLAHLCRVVTEVEQCSKYRMLAER